MGMRLLTATTAEAILVSVNSDSGPIMRDLASTGPYPPRVVPLDLTVRRFLQPKSNEIMTFFLDVVESLLLRLCAEER